MIQSHFLRSLAVAVAVISFPAGIGPALAQPADFAFRFEYGCHDNVNGRLDTFNGTFAAVPTSPNPALSVTIPLSLSPEQMRAISDTVEQIRFFDSPAILTGLPAGVSWNEAVKINHPIQFRLEIRHSGRLHVVSGDDEIVSPLTEQASRLRQLFLMIHGMLREYPEVRRLPRFACGG